MILFIIKSTSTSSLQKKSLQTKSSVLDVHPISSFRYKNIRNNFSNLDNENKLIMHDIDGSHIHLNVEIAKKYIVPYLN